MAIPEYNYIPTYIKRTIDNKPKDVITASYWNELFNLLIKQGDHTAKELGNVLNHFTAAINDVEEIAGSKYVKPTNGIPKTDLAAAVQTSLDKADTALQTHQSLAAYRTAEAQDLIDNTKQDKLIAGENITITADGKTISAAGKANALGYFRATYTRHSAEDFTLDKTFAQIKEEIANNNLIMLVDNFSDIDGMFILVYNSSGTVAFTAMIDDAKGWLTFVVTSDDKWQVDVQSRVSFDMYDALSNRVGKLLNLTTTDKTNLVAAVNEVKQAADGKQDKLIAGENITIAADGKTISATGSGGGVLPVTLTLGAPIQLSNSTVMYYTADRSRDEIKSAIDSGITVLKCSLIRADNPNEVAKVVYLNFSSMDSSAFFVGFDSSEYVILSFPITSSVEGVLKFMTLPTTTSQLENDSGFLTLATLPKYEGVVV